MTFCKNSQELRRTHFHILPTSFYDRPTALVARDLLGKVLRVRDSKIWRSGIILETEAYVANDPANHAFRGRTNRNQSMFKGPSTAYVYSIHQVYCVNAVTRPGEAVLIRSLQPKENVTLPCEGPGKLCRALGITKLKHDGQPLTGTDIQVVEGNEVPVKITVSRRVGVTKGKNMLLRFNIS